MFAEGGKRKTAHRLGRTPIQGGTVNGIVHRTLPLLSREERAFANGGEKEGKIWPVKWEGWVHNRKSDDRPVKDTHFRGIGIREKSTVRPVGHA